MLIRLTYASLLADSCDDRCIHDIVDASASANRSHGITGILAVDGAKVLQILEGEDVAVVALFEHIRRDPRHVGVVELSRAEIDKPHFEDWGMVRRSMVDAVLLAETL